MRQGAALPAGGTGKYSAKRFEHYDDDFRSWGTRSRARGCATGSACCPRCGAGDVSAQCVDGTAVPVRYLLGRLCRRARGRGGAHCSAWSRRRPRVSVLRLPQRDGDDGLWGFNGILVGAPSPPFWAAACGCGWRWCSVPRSRCGCAGFNNVMGRWGINSPHVSLRALYLDLPVGRACHDRVARHGHRRARAARSCRSGGVAGAVRDAGGRMAPRRGAGLPARFVGDRRALSLRGWRSRTFGRRCGPLRGRP